MSRGAKIKVVKVNSKGWCRGVISASEWMASIRMGGEKKFVSMVQQSHLSLHHPSVGQEVCLYQVILHDHTRYCSSRTSNLFPFHYRGPPSTNQMSANEPGVYSLLPKVLTRILGLRSRKQDLIFGTHVCRHCRPALLSAPFLWTRISYLNVN